MAHRMRDGAADHQHSIRGASLVRQPDMAESVRSNPEMRRYKVMAVEIASERAIDRRIYIEELAPWLPARIIDCHVHVGLKEFWGPVSPERARSIWALEVAQENSWEDFRRTCSSLFPEQRVSVIAFASVAREVDIESANEYVRAGVADPANDAVGLFATRPEWDAGLIRDAMFQGFKGIKPYPDLAMRDTLETSIYDFLPREHLAALDEFGGILMLHLPRSGRLADPDNVREVLEISDTYPNVTIILAHVGRAYGLTTAKRGLPHFIDRESVYFDISANLNADVFQCALEMIGPGRLLYGSDLPVTLMRGVREHFGEHYVNYTDGPYSWNTHRKSAEEEANYTYYLYEQLRSLVSAIKKTGLGRDACDRVLYSNCARLIGR